MVEVGGKPGGKTGLVTVSETGAGECWCGFGVVLEDEKEGGDDEAGGDGGVADVLGGDALG